MDSELNSSLEKMPKWPRAKQLTISEKHRPMHSKIPHHSHRKSQDKETSVGEMGGNQCSHVTVGIWNSAAAVEKTDRSSPMWLGGSTLTDIISKRNENLWSALKMCTWTFLATLFSQNSKIETTQMSTGWWMNKHNVICTKMEYYSAIKRNELDMDATPGINVEDAALSQRSQIWKDNFCLIPLTWGMGGGGMDLETR